MERVVALAVGIRRLAPPLMAMPPSRTCGSQRRSSHAFCCLICQLCVPRPPWLRCPVWPHTSLGRSVSLHPELTCRNPAPPRYLSQAPAPPLARASRSLCSTGSSPPASPLVWNLVSGHQQTLRQCTEDLWQVAPSSAGKKVAEGQRVPFSRTAVQSIANWLALNNKNASPHSSGVQVPARPCAL